MRSLLDVTRYESSRLDLPNDLYGLLQNFQLYDYSLFILDNWAFIYAQRMALQARVPLLTCFCLVPKYASAPLRHFKFLLGGLCEVEKECSELDIPFHMLIGFAKDVLPGFLKEKNVGLLVNDFSPLKGSMSWMNDVKERVDQSGVGSSGCSQHIPVGLHRIKRNMQQERSEAKSTKLKTDIWLPFLPLSNIPTLRRTRYHRFVFLDVCTR